MKTYALSFMTEIGFDDEAVEAQIEEVKGKKPYHTFEELLLTNDTWEVK